MRTLVLCFALALIACSNDNAISPDRSGDGGVLADGGNTADGGRGDGGTTGPGDISASGSRLKIQKISGDDGSTFVTGLFDSTLNVPCSFGRASDGSTRCMPSATLPTLFSESGCSTPIAYQLPSCSGPLPVYASRIVESCYGGPSAVEIHQVMGVYTGNIYEGSPGNCIQANSLASTYTFYSVGGALPPSSFVLGTESHE